MIFRAALVALAICGLLYAAALGFVYSQQTALLYPGDHGPDVLPGGIAGLRDVRVQTADGLALTAWFKPPAPGAPTLLYFHGNAGNLNGRAGRVRLFGATGWGELFLEYRGYGGNPGTPSEAGLDADARGAIAYLAGQNIASSRVILYGESLGTGVAVRLATEVPVAAVILDSPYTSIADMAQRRYWYFPARYLIHDRFELLARIARINAPLLVMQGERDQVVPPAMGRAVFAAANEPKEFWSNPQADHFDVAEAGGAAIMAFFVARHVPGG